MRLAVAATAPLGADVLGRLASKHDVAYLLTRPDRPQGRGRKVAPPPAKEVAERLGLEVRQPERLDGFDPEEDPVVLVNPRFTLTSEERESDTEGCLSLQGVVIPVERHVSVTVEGKDPDGNDVTLELEGLPARIAQHELDHLDGVLILDRTTPEARREALAILRPQPVLVR